MRELTQTNLFKFLKEFQDAVIARNFAPDDEAQLDFYIEWAQKLEDTFKLPAGVSGEDLLLTSLDNPSLEDYTWIFPRETAKISDIPESIKLNVVEKSGYNKVFKSHHDVLNNLEKIVAYLSTLQGPAAEALVDQLQRSNDDILLGSLGSICAPRKYLSNGGLSLNNGYGPIEIRIKSADNVPYRVYGIFKDNYIYLLDAYIKNSGQTNADHYFNNFINTLANPYISNTLRESLLYYIMCERRRELTEDYSMTDAFTELNAISDLSEQADYLRGHSAGYFGELKEDNSSSAYNKGFTEGARIAKIASFRNFLKKKLNK